MKCLRCGSEQFNRIRGLSFCLDGVPGRNNVGVIAAYCQHCNFLSLEVNPAAVPEEATEPIRET